MFSAASLAIKRRAPALHGFMKQAFRWSKLPSVKFLNGNLTLAAPSLIGDSPTERHVLRWIDRLLQPGDTFFDVGAHYGWMSLAACHRVGARGKVVAFEPSPQLVKFLRYHKRVNRFHQMEIVERAVADSGEQTVPLYIVDRGESFLNSLVDHRTESTMSLAQQASTVPVQTTSLDHYCHEAKLCPNTVKIDVEGAELLVLRGCSVLLAQRRAAFIVAIHPTWLPQGQQASEIFELFRVRGYTRAASEVVRYDGADFGDYVFLPSNNADHYKLLGRDVQRSLSAGGDQSARNSADDFESVRDLV